jgi:uncharacterized protein (DUF58 family)
MYNQHGVVPVYAVVDLSASMGFQGAASKWAVLVEFLSILALSTSRTGDPFGLVGCGRTVLPQFLLPITRNSQAIREAVNRIRSHKPAAGGAEGLIEAAPLIGYQRSLVFIISDFHFPVDLTRRLLCAFARHDLVPIVLWDPAEFRDPPAFGVAHVCDSETGAGRYVVLRPSLRARLRAVFARRCNTLEEIFSEFGHKPYFLLDKIDCDHLNQFFSER